MRKLLILGAAVLIVIGAVSAYRGIWGVGNRGAPSAARNVAAPVITVTALSEDFPTRRETIGSVQTPASVVVKARIDSQVMEQHVTDGQVVAKGDLLFVLDDREIQATIAKDVATVARDQAQLAKAVADLERTQQLIARNVAARQQLDQATADRDAAAATLQADQAQLANDRVRETFTRITAPIAGRVGAVRVTPGNLVAAGDSTGLLTITQMKPLWVSFSLPERDVPALRAALARTPTAIVHARVKNSDAPPAVGTLNFVDSSVDPASGTIQARAVFPNDDLTLWPGQYVDVVIDLETRPDTVTIPTVAVQSSQKGPYIFVAQPDNTAQMRFITTGDTVEDRIAVEGGLQAGERVVVEGQLRLADGTPIVETKEPEQKGDVPDLQAVPANAPPPDTATPQARSPQNDGAIDKAREDKALPRPVTSGRAPLNAAEAGP